MLCAKGGTLSASIWKRRELQYGAGVHFGTLGHPYVLPFFDTPSRAWARLFK